MALICRNFNGHYLCFPGCRFILVLLREGLYDVSLSDDKWVDIIDAFNTTSRHLDDILNIKNV